MNYFTTRQVANLLGYNDDSYIRKLLLSGKLSAKKVGTQWMVSEESVHKYKVKNDIRSKYKALISFNEELRILADNILDRTVKLEGPKDLFVSFAIGKCYKTHAAILLLCRQGYGEDASVLARSLFDLLINLLYILADKTDERAYRYMRYDWVLRKKMFDYAKGKPELINKINERVRNPLPNDSTIKDVENEASSVQKMYKYKNNSWSDKNLYDMALEVGRIDAYKTVYRLQCQLHHNLPRTMNEYAKQEQSSIVFNVGQSENWVEESLVVSFDFFYSIVVAFNSHYKLNLNKEILEIEDRYISELSDLNKKE